MNMARCEFNAKLIERFKSDVQEIEGAGGCGSRRTRDWHQLLKFFLHIKIAMNKHILMHNTRMIVNYVGGFIITKCHNKMSHCAEHSHTITYVRCVTWCVSKCKLWLISKSLHIADTFVFLSDNSVRYMYVQH